MSLVRDTITRFKIDYDKYLLESDIVNNLKIERPARIAMLTWEGAKLVANYYKDKYRTNITFSKLENIAETKESDNYFLSEITEIVHNARKKQEDYREAIIYRVDKHYLGIFYLREKSMEALLIADSLGATQASMKLSKLVLTAQTNIKVLKLWLQRQVDEYSCLTDLLVVARDMTKKAMNSEQYQIFDLFEKLQVLEFIMQEEFQTTYVDRLPIALSKSAQSPVYIKQLLTDARQSPDDLKAYQLFLVRYSQTVTLLPKPDKLEGRKEPKIVVIASYLRRKTWKLVNIIVIQHYIEQLCILLGNAWNKDIRDEFVSGAKKAFAIDLKGESVYQFSTLFLKEKQEGVANQKREIVFNFKTFDF